MAAKLIITRKNEWANRFRSYKVFIDGEMVGTINNGKTEEFPLSVVNQTVRCKIDWLYSNVYNINVSDNDIVYLKVGSSTKRKWITFIILFIYIFGVNVLMNNIRTPNPLGGWLPLVLFIPFILYYIYLFSIVRHKYLQLEKDTTNIFAS